MGLSVALFDYVSPSPNSRGFWTGSQGGDAGLVIPRFQHTYGHAWDSGDTVPAGILSGLTLALSTKSSDFTTSILYPLAYTFNGKVTDLYMDGDALPYDAVFTRVEIVVTPETYFEFSDGVTSVWDSVTGAQLRNPLNP